MTSELIIDVRNDDMSIALLEDKVLVEYQIEPRSASFSLNNIYIAKVKKLLPGLNACFVELGYEREAFLHYLDLGPNFATMSKYLTQVQSDRRRLWTIDKATRQPEPPKDSNVSTVLKVGQEVLVQIIKEPISTKGPRLTCDISLAGRFMVLTPLGDKVAVSSKIKKGAERTRLKQIMHSIKPKNFGVIVRTSAEGATAEELENEMRILVGKWNEAITTVQKTQQRPKVVYEETGRAVAMLRDLFNPSFEAVTVNNAEVYEHLKQYITQIAPDKADIVKLYEGDMPIFDHFAITRQVKTGFGRTVNFKRGAYMIIEHTEALHVVDINSGNRMRSENGQEANALEVNLGAADELARQLRLRDMGGIIVVDFIDMNLPEDRQALYERMCQRMQTDRAKHNILPLSKFGLMQITRQRVRPAQDVNVEEVCPTCLGKGKIKSSIMFVEKLEQKIDMLVSRTGIKRFCLHVHPYVAAYINKGLWSLKRKWQFKYGFGVKVIASEKLGFLQYEFYDVKHELIAMPNDNNI